MAADRKAARVVACKSMTKRQPWPSRGGMTKADLTVAGSFKSIMMRPPRLSSSKRSPCTDPSGRFTPFSAVQPMAGVLITTR